jgi:hypothetical protein
LLDLKPIHARYSTGLLSGVPVPVTMAVLLPLYQPPATCDDPQAHEPADKAAGAGDRSGYARTRKICAAGKQSVEHTMQALVFPV